MSVQARDNGGFYGKRRRDQKQPGYTPRSSLCGGCCAAETLPVPPDLLSMIRNEQSVFLAGHFWSDTPTLTHFASF